MWFLTLWEIRKSEKIVFFFYETEIPNQQAWKVCKYPNKQEINGSKKNNFFENLFTKMPVSKIANLAILHAHSWPFLKLPSDFASKKSKFVTSTPPLLTRRKEFIHTYIMQNRDTTWNDVKGPRGDNKDSYTIWSCARNCQIHYFRPMQKSNNSKTMSF